MSTDYDVCCRHCKASTHIGQRFSSGWSFGFSSHDTEGRLAAGAFIMAHTGCGKPGELPVFVCLSDFVPDDYALIEYEGMAEHAMGVMERWSQ